MNLDCIEYTYNYFIREVNNDLNWYNMENVTIKFKYKILEDYTFTYIDKNLVKNPYGRCGKKHKIWFNKP